MRNLLPRSESPGKGNVRRCSTAPKQCSAQLSEHQATWKQLCTRALGKPSPSAPHRELHRIKTQAGSPPCPHSAPTRGACKKPGVCSCTLVWARGSHKRHARGDFLFSFSPRKL